MRRLFGIFILSVACCMIAGADMLLFAKTETYQLMFFGGYAVSRFCWCFSACFAPATGGYIRWV